MYCCDVLLRCIAAMYCCDVPRNFFGDCRPAPMGAFSEVCLPDFKAGSAGIA